MENQDLPKTVEEAAEKAIDMLDADSRKRIAKMAKKDLWERHFGLGIAIRNRFALHGG